MLYLLLPTAVTVIECVGLVSNRIVCIGAEETLTIFGYPEEYNNA
jgi:hypothetical protein